MEDFIFDKAPDMIEWPVAAVIMTGIAAIIAAIIKFVPVMDRTGVRHDKCQRLQKRMADIESRQAVEETHRVNLQMWATDLKKEVHDMSAAFHRDLGEVKTEMAKLLVAIERNNNNINKR